MRRGWRLGYLGRIPLYLDPSLILVPALVGGTLASAPRPAQLPPLPSPWQWIVGLLVVVFFLLSVLAHELAHSWAAQARRVPVLGITLSLAGGIAWLADEPRTPLDEMIITAAGPFANLLITGLTLGLYAVTLFLSRLVPSDAPPLLQGIAASAWYLVLANVFLAVFNLLPAFPLDGGRLVRSVLWALTGGADRALLWSVSVAKLVSGLVAIAGLAASVRTADPIFFLVGVTLAWVLYHAARQSLAQQRVRERLRTVIVSSLMERRFPQVPPHLTLDVIADQLLASQPAALIPVTEGSGLVGILLPAAVRRVPPARRPTVTAASVMRPASSIPALAPQDHAARALQLMVGAGLAALPVVTLPSADTSSVELVGLLDRRALLTLLYQPPPR